MRTRIAAALVLAVVAGVLLWRHDAPSHRLVAHFSRAVGIHAGSDVRILGVKVGEVGSVTPAGRSITVSLRYESRYAVPADAMAVIVPPSIVSDRYIQLTPAYTGGPTLADGADLPVARTVVPLELDEIYRSLDELNRALGPNGSNVDGALSELVHTARENLDGNGARLHDALAGLAEAMSTVADGRDDLFGTIANLGQFVSALARSDVAVREFNQRLAAVAEQLAAERDDLAGAVNGLATALADITAFVRDNRAALSSNVAALADITSVLVRQQKALVEVLDVAPLALSNLNLAYNSRSGTLDTRDNAMGPYDPASFACSLAAGVAPGNVPPVCFDLARMLAARGLPLTPELGRLIGQPAGTPGGSGASPVVPDPPDVPDGTLGGILRGGR